MAEFADAAICGSVTRLTVQAARTCYSDPMKWLWWHPDRNAIIRTVLGLLALLAVLGFVMIRFPFPGAQRSDAFGPEWECQPQPRGDPVCVKKPAK